MFIVAPFMSQAQPPEGQDWRACQLVTKAGLNFENGRWQPKKFQFDLPFILIAGDGGITKASASKAMDADEWGIMCAGSNVDGDILCISHWVGKSLAIRRKTGRCAIGNIRGDIFDENQDSLAVKPFECVKGWPKDDTSSQLFSMP